MFASPYGAPTGAPMLSPDSAPLRVTSSRSHLWPGFGFGSRLRLLGLHFGCISDFGWIGLGLVLALEVLILDGFGLISLGFGLISD